MNKETIKKINLIAVLEDIQQQLMIELKPDLRHGMKQMIGDAEKHTAKFIRACDKVFSNNSAESFGMSADEIRQVIEDCVEK